MKLQPEAAKKGSEQLLQWILHFLQAFRLNLGMRQSICSLSRNISWEQSLCPLTF